MPATIEQMLAFREKTQEVFAQIQKEFNIDVRIPLIQSAHESNWGLSQLAINEANIFGMTPGSKWLEAKRGKIPWESLESWSSLGSATGYYPTTEYSPYHPDQVHYWDFPGDIKDKREDGKGGSILTVKRYFRKYANWNESAWDWSRKIARDPRYRFAYDAAKTGDVYSYADAIKQSGYATDKTYDVQLTSINKIIDTLPMV